MSIKKDPHMMGENPLEFDNVSKDELMEKTNKEKAQLYLSKFKKHIRPFKRYEEYFTKNDKDVSRIFSEIKNYYVRYVLKEGWSERKYTACINNIFANNDFLGPKAIEENGYKFDEGSLIIRERSRRRRI